MGRQKSHEGDKNLFLDLERDEIVLHLEKLSIAEKVVNDAPEDGGEIKLEPVIRSPVLRLMSRGHDLDEAAHAPRPVPASHSAGFGAMLSVTSIDMAMAGVILILIVLLVVSCKGNEKPAESVACANMWLRIVRRPFQRRHNSGLILQ